ncbi:hypothetical protein [Piscinibacter gummiphilus]|uniref:Uncharacterized protein n=1 Tax=Piscinibacter gummiphilus TaxID=946333 RepID=A0A1W6LA40_9BURK|nr:hypothetical protein [Piscinibacter gummiphilus]ARN21171.1 hypothetical protein A4W93_15420 [Piscinibacter gummiphilus]ATU65854.1 hypothetical protein CPZ87_15500 [Piscinibacter gummiphilus]GLS93730.1 hypothetical protein GCM10007918_10210 [Piscinibacter gummiphilus]
MAVSSNPFSPWTENPWQHWLPSPSFGGSTFVQPINPWNFTINHINSRAPATEAAVVAKHSYGRQIGRISDLLHTLLTKHHADLLDESSAAEFMAMWREVEAIKATGAAERVRQLAKDLAALKVDDPLEHARLRKLVQGSL